MSRFTPPRHQRRPGLYTAAGGTEAVTKTHLLQMTIVTAGMATALFMVFHRLSPDISFSSAVHAAGKLGKLNVINFVFSWKDRYNFWSGLIGGGFLALSYFGTDQSQVQRYLSGRSIAQSRLGLLANGVLKVPMQFIILMGSLFYGTILGIFLIAFYFKNVRGHATFVAAIIAELSVLACYFFTEIFYLWFNVIGCVILISLANILNPLLKGKKLAITQPVLRV
jgi:Na+/proline symporter